MANKKQKFSRMLAKETKQARKELTGKSKKQKYVRWTDYE